MKLKQMNWKALFISLAISLGAGGLSSLLTRDSMEQYGQLYQPPLAPPGWLFPIVWTILFILMGVSSYLIFTSNATENEKKNALLLYGIQLVANILWSVIFFRWNAYLLAFAWLLLLWYLIYQTIRTFYKIKPLAGILLFPYIAWVTFAGYLNLAIAVYYWN